MKSMMANMATGGSMKMPDYRTYGGARTLPVNPFIKMPERELLKPIMPQEPFMPRVFEPSKPQLRDILGSIKRPEPTNTAVRPSVGHPRFGFQTMLPSVSAPLPTAPAVVGGNVDWTSLKSSPATRFLHSQLSLGRPMMPPQALGSLVRLNEPTGISIHTTY